MSDRILFDVLCDFAMFLSLVMIFIAIRGLKNER
jgi:hypothetical protein